MIARLRGKNLSKDQVLGRCIARRGRPLRTEAHFFGKWGEQALGRMPLTKRPALEAFLHQGATDRGHLLVRAATAFLLRLQVSAAAVVSRDARWWSRHNAAAPMRQSNIMNAASQSALT